MKSRILLCSIYLIFINSGIIFTSSPTIAQEVNRSWANHAFGVSEKLNFNIDYAFITAGYAEISIDTMIEIGGRQCYQVVSKVRSNKVFDIVFKVRDRVETNIDVRGIYSRRYFKQLQEGKYRDIREVIYEPERGLAHLLIKGVYKETTKIESCAQDILSALFFVRTLEFDVGDTININLHDMTKSYPLKVRVNRRERVQVPAGEFDCLVVEPFLETEGMFRSKGKIELWLTDDERKIPVLMRTEIAIIGYIDAKLAQYIPGKPVELK